MRWLPQSVIDLCPIPILIESGKEIKGFPGPIVGGLNKDVMGLFEFAFFIKVPPICQKRIYLVGAIKSVAPEAQPQNQKECYQGRPDLFPFSPFTFVLGYI